MNYSLKEKFDEAASILKVATGFYGATTLMHRTPWVRILLDYDEHGDAFSIVVEMSLPGNLDMIELDSPELIDRLSKHLQYLKKLSEAGFELSVIATGCIYCATKKLHDIPDDNLFTLLMPPEID